MEYAAFYTFVMCMACFFLGRACGRYEINNQLKTRARIRRAMRERR